MTKDNPETIVVPEQEIQVVANSLKKVQVWATGVIFVLMIGIFLISVVERNALTVLRDEVTDVQIAVRNTEEILNTIVEEETGPEAEANRQLAFDAIRNITLVVELLCTLDEPSRQATCTELGIETTEELR